MYVHMLNYSSKLLQYLLFFLFLFLVVLLLLVLPWAVPVHRRHHVFRYILNNKYM